ncbi:MAG: hypothetical protein AMS24_02345 [Chlamydiae bacterium SM23_39]|nr:MAG: hypothetical protein AMS24_02345 [Chlamydiae bacterium SM23_39]
MSTGNLLKIYFNVKILNFLDQIYIFQYYKNLKYCFLDIFFIFIYLFINPYKISKKFLFKKNKKNIYMYGETPIKTLKRIVEECDISSKDKLIDLGAGRLKTSFWLSNIVGCNILAIEQIPIFTKIAFFLKKIFMIKNVKIKNDDFLKIDYEEATIIYLYGTCLEDYEIKKISEKIKNNTKVISISYSLSHYFPKQYNLIKVFPVAFPWGETKCYFCVKVKKV